MLAVQGKGTRRIYRQTGHGGLTGGAQRDAIAAPFCCADPAIAAARLEARAATRHSGFETLPLARRGKVIVARAIALKGNEADADQCGDRSRKG